MVLNMIYILFILIIGFNEPRVDDFDLEEFVDAGDDGLEDASFASKISYILTCFLLFYLGFY